MVQKTISAVIASLALMMGSIGVRPVAAQELELAADPVFLVETIVVENAERISPDIVISESLLEEGKEYAETELRDAVYRIVRLPFILDASFSLRKGSERGRYELVITLDETRLWFFGLESIDTYWEEPISVNGLSTTDRTEASVALGGRRWAVGRQGLFFLALGGNDGTLTVGYQQFNLFDRDIFVSGSLSLADCNRDREGPDDPGDEGCRTELTSLGLDPTFSTWSFDGDGAKADLTLEVPMRGNHSLRVRYSARSIENGIRRPAFEPTSFIRFRDRVDVGLNVSWVYNSVDDPVFPTDGTVVEAGGDLKALAAEFGAHPRMESYQFGALVSATRYRPVHRRQAVWLRLDAFLGLADVENLPLEGGRRVDDDLEVYDARATLGHSLFLVQSRENGKVRDLRWESDLALFASGTSPDFDQPDNPLEGWRLTSSLAYRNRWGVFRIGASYFASGMR